MCHSNKCQRMKSRGSVKATSVQQLNLNILHFYLRPLRISILCLEYIVKSQPAYKKRFYYRICPGLLIVHDLDRGEILEAASRSCSLLRDRVSEPPFFRSIKSLSPTLPLQNLSQVESDLLGRGCGVGCLEPQIWSQEFKVSTTLSTEAL